MDSASAESLAITGLKSAATDAVAFPGSQAGGEPPPRVIWPVRDGDRENFSNAGETCDTPAMNTFLSAVMILWIFGMVIYLTKDM